MAKSLRPDLVVVDTEQNSAIVEYGEDMPLTKHMLRRAVG